MKFLARNVRPRYTHHRLDAVWFTTAKSVVWLTHLFLSRRVRQARRGSRQHSTLNDYDNPGPCLRMAWADTENPVY